MPVLLRIDSSVDLQNSRSRALTEAFASAWEARGDAYTTVVRDLHENPVPHMTTTAQHWPERLRGDQSLAPDIERLQQELIDELVAADLVIIGAPMYNYGIASTLKAWLDLVHVPGTTAPFDEPAQPLQGKPVVILTARGGPNDGVTDECVIAPLTMVLGTGLGMEVHSVAVTRTLADILPDLDRSIADEELRSGSDQARSLALKLA